MQYSRKIFLLILIFISAVTCLSAQEEEAYHINKGDKSVGLFLGASGFGDSSAVTLGASFQYFVTNTTAPGVKVMGSFSSNNLYQGFLVVDQYLYRSGSVLPFIFAEAGYFYSDLVYKASEEKQLIVGGLLLKEDTRWKGGIARLGAGLNIFIGENMAIRCEYYYQWLYVDFDKKVPQLNDFGFGLGFSLFI